MINFYQFLSFKLNININDYEGNKTIQTSIHYKNWVVFKGEENQSLVYGIFLKGIFYGQINSNVISSDENSGILFIEHPFRRCTTRENTIAGCRFEVEVGNLRNLLMQSFGEMKYLNIFLRTLKVPIPLQESPSLIKR